MRFIAGLVLVILSISSIVRSEPDAVASHGDAEVGDCEKHINDPKFFCQGRHGRYAWRNAMEIVCCPQGRIEKLKEGRFAPLLGRVPKSYHGELAFDVHKFCEGKSGYFCPPKGTDSLGMWKCPEGLQVPCPWGQVCAQHGKHCMCVNPHKPPVQDCKTKIIHEDKREKITEITCKGDPCVTKITSKCDERPHTNVVCTKTCKCCTEETVSTTVTRPCSCQTTTVTTRPSCPTSTNSCPTTTDTETCSWVKPTPCSCASECTCSRTRSCQPTNTCSCHNGKTTTVTNTIWKNETCRVTDHRCTTTKTMTESYVCLSYATHCVYDPRFEALEQQNLNWAERPKCEKVVVCDKWGWKGCRDNHDMPFDAKVEREVRSAFDEAEDEGRDMLRGFEKLAEEQVGLDL